MGLSEYQFCIHRIITKTLILNLPFEGVKSQARGVCGGLYYIVLTEFFLR